MRAVDGAADRSYGIHVAELAGLLEVAIGGRAALRLELPADELVVEDGRSKRGETTAP